MNDLNFLAMFDSLFYTKHDKKHKKRKEGDMKRSHELLQFENNLQPKHQNIKTELEQSLRTIKVHTAKKTAQRHLATWHEV